MGRLDKIRCRRRGGCCYLRQLGPQGRTVWHCQRRVLCRRQLRVDRIGEHAQGGQRLRRKVLGVALDLVWQF